MTSQHGGARFHPPGREGGRPKNQYPTRQLKIQASDDEWYDFLENLPANTRERYLYLAKLIGLIEAP